jgi:hypothetical protein
MSRQNELKAKLPKLKRFMNATRNCMGLLPEQNMKTLLIIPILASAIWFRENQQPVAKQKKENSKNNSKT